jgi:opacity protein-like surface antigen
MSSAFGQTPEAPTGDKDVISIGAGMGFISFFGDLNKDSELSTFTNLRPGYNFQLERRFGDYLGVSLNGLLGSAAHSQRDTAILLNRNFESNITQVGINFALHFDNDVMINRNSAFSPYFGAGVAYTLFDPYGDQTDANGNTYHYWSGGAIKDLPENHEFADSAVVLQRDYTYETKLNDSLENYDRNTLAFPLTFGLKWKFSEYLQGRLFASYTLTQSDFIDNVAGNSNNDKYLFTGFSLNYLIRKKDKSLTSHYDNVDFAALNKDDTDKDGVHDFDDECPHTPQGLKVDGKGCPMDDDKDGVANHLDEEPNSLKGATVDSEGITVDDAYLARQASARDSVATIRSQAFAESPNLQTLQQLDDRIQENNGSNSSNIPQEFRSADSNNNGYIESNEITQTIDGFFEGGSDFTVESIQDLIDYFFEQ